MNIISICLINEEKIVKTKDPIGIQLSGEIVRRRGAHL